MSKGEDNFEIADHTLEGLYKAITVPFFLSYLILMAADVCLVIAILIGALNVPKWMAALNSIVFLIIGVTLRKINPMCKVRIGLDFCPASSCRASAWLWLVSSGSLL